MQTCSNFQLPPSCVTPSDLELLEVVYGLGDGPIQRLHHGESGAGLPRVQQSTLLLLLLFVLLLLVGAVPTTTAQLTQSGQLGRSCSVLPR